MSKKVTSVSMEEHVIKDLDEKRGGLKRSYIINELAKKYIKGDVEIE